MVSLSTCFFLLIIYIFALFFTKYDIMSPGPIFTAVFLVSTCMLLVLGRGQLDIHWNTSYLIIIACIVAVVGDCFSRLIIRVGESTEKVQLKETDLKRKYYGLFLSKKFNQCAIILMVIFILYTYWDIRTHTNVGLSNSGTLLGAFREQGSHKSLLSSLLNGLCSAFVYFYMYVLLVNHFFSKELPFKYWIPVILYVPGILVTGARIQLLYFLSVFLFQYVTLYFEKKGRNLRSARKLLINILLILIVFCFVFYVAGFLTGKSVGFELEDIVLVYFGGPIYGLDWYMQRIGVADSNGLLSFSAIAPMLSAFGINIGHVDFGLLVSGTYSFYPIFPNKGLYGNVYTVLMSLVHDFGISCALIIIFLICAVFSFFYRKACLSRSSCIPTLVLSVLYIPMVMVSVENLFSDDLNYKRLIVVLSVYLLAKISNKSIQRRLRRSIAI